MTLCRRLTTVARVLIAAMIITESSGVFARTPMPFGMDTKKQAILSRAHKAAGAQNWSNAIAIAKSSGDKDMIFFIEALRAAQIVPGKYDGYKLSRILLHGASPSVSPIAPVIVAASEESQMAPLSMPVEAIIERYNTLDKPRKEIADRHLRSIWRNRTMSLADENKFYGRFKHLMTIADNNKRMDNLLWSNGIEAANRMVHRIGGTQKSLLSARLRIMNAKKYQEVRRVLYALKGDEVNDNGVLYAKTLWMHRTKTMYKDTVKSLVQMPAPPNHKLQWWAISRYYIRDLLVKDSTARMHKTAYILASKYRPSDGAKALEAEWTAGWISLRFLNMPQAAHGHFTRMYERASTMHDFSRSAYWAGNASKALGNKQNALQWFSIAGAYPTTFYGQLALTITNKASYLDLPKYSVGQKTLAAVRGNRAAKLLFYATSLRDSALAATLMRIAVSSTKNPEELEVITSIPVHFAMTHLSVIGGIEAIKHKVLLIGSLYPTQYANHKVPIDAPLRLAVIRQESLFDRTAVSSSGAKGVMQLMPKTAQSVANRLDMRFSEERLFDPKFNIMLGSHYLKNALSFTDNNLIMSLVLYNAGPGSLAKFVTNYGDPRKMRNIDDVVDWIELIPYHETRNYVQRILESLQIYRSILSAGQDPKRLEISKDLMGKYVN